MTSLLTLGGQKPLLNPLVLFFGFTSLHPINPFLPPFRRSLPPWTLVQAWQLPVVQFCVFTLDEKEWEWGMGSLVGRISIRQFSHYQYQSSLGIWPVCYYAERAVVSSVRCHMAICPFCTLVFICFRKADADSEENLYHHSCQFYRRMVSTIFPWLWDETPNFLTAQAWSILTSLTPGHVMWYSVGGCGENL